MKRNGIKHIRSAPYHPSTNGTAERFVQTFKKAMNEGFTKQLAYSNPPSLQFPTYLLYNTTHYY